MGGRQGRWRAVRAKMGLFQRTSAAASVTTCLLFFIMNVIACVCLLSLSCVLSTLHISSLEVFTTALQGRKNYLKMQKVRLREVKYISGVTELIGAGAYFQIPVWLPPSSAFLLSLTTTCFHNIRACGWESELQSYYFFYYSGCIATRESISAMSTTWQAPL